MDVRRSPAGGAPESLSFPRWNKIFGVAGHAERLCTRAEYIPAGPPYFASSSMQGRLYKLGFA